MLNGGSAGVTQDGTGQGVLCSSCHMQTDELKLFLLHNSLAQENGGCLKPVTFCLHFPHITGEKTFMVCLKRPVSQGELELES